MNEKTKTILEDLSNGVAHKRNEFAIIELELMALEGKASRDEIEQKRVWVMETVTQRVDHILSAAFKLSPLLSNEERDVVVAAARKHLADGRLAIKKFEETLSRIRKSFS